MRVLFWILLVVNVGVFAYFNLQSWANKQVQNNRPDIAADKIKILTDAEVQAMPPRPHGDAVTGVARTDEPTACYEWAGFAQNELPQAVNLVNAFFIPHQISEQSVSQSTRYWVYKPPLPNADAANAKGEELKRMGINEFFIVQEPSMRFAISFGIFREEALADKLLEDLRKRGVKEVVKETRNQGAAVSSILMRDVTETLYGQLKKNLPDYPRTELKEAVCPAV